MILIDTIFFFTNKCFVSKSRTLLEQLKNKLTNFYHFYVTLLHLLQVSSSTVPSALVSVLWVLWPSCDSAVPSSLFGKFCHTFLHRTVLRRTVHRCTVHRRTVHRRSVLILVLFYTDLTLWLGASREMKSEVECLNLGVDASKYFCWQIFFSSTP